MYAPSPRLRSLTLLRPLLLALVIVLALSALRALPAALSTSQQGIARGPLGRLPRDSRQSKESLFPASVITVCLSGCNHSSIQAAVDAASSGDIITIASGTYIENVTISQNLTLQGSGSSTIIDGNQTGSVLSIVGANVSIAGVMVRNGTALGSGGGIFNNGGTVTLTDSTVSSNSSHFSGGGIAHYYGTMTINNSTI